MDLKIFKTTTYNLLDPSQSQIGREFSGGGIYVCVIPNCDIAIGGGTKLYANGKKVDKFVISRKVFMAIVKKSGNETWI